LVKKKKIIAFITQAVNYSNEYEISNKVKKFDCTCHIITRILIKETRKNKKNWNFIKQRLFLSVCVDVKFSGSDKKEQNRVRKIGGFHGCDYEERRFLGCGAV
jgi:hypothetical protein